MPGDNNTKHKQNETKEIHKKRIRHIKNMINTVELRFFHAHFI